jgi:hypothetical protein
MRVLIDGDPIVYRAGFSSQNDWKILRWVDVVDEDDPESDIEREAFFAYVVEMKDFIEQEGLDPDEYQVTVWVDPLSEQYCLKIVKDNLQNIIDAVEGFLAETDDEVTEVKVFLSGKTNFRNAVATIPTFKQDGTPVQGYKANRSDSVRPYWYARIREYMCDVWDAVLFEGIEADDALAIEQWAEDEYEPTTIIATIDKDLRNVPGWHYNILKKDDELISTQQAREHFYRQVLTGDPTDNIPGCYRVGKKRAEATITRDMSEQEMYDACLGIYEENLEKFPDRHGPHTSAATSLLENARLLWMLQHRDQLWTPPGQPDESIEDAGLLEVEEEW